MKASLLLFIMCFVNTVAFTQDLPNFISNTKVTTITYWEVGDKVSYHCVKENSIFKNGKDKPKKESFSEYDINFIVLEQTDSSYLIEMTYSNLNENLESEYNLGQMVEQLKIRYVTDELGGYDSIVNAKELLVVAGRVFDEMKDGVGIEDTLALQMLDKWKDSFVQIENIEGLFIEDVITVHGIYGLELDLYEDVEYEMIYATLADIYVGGIGVITLKSVDKVRDRCLVYEVQKPNSDEIASYLEEIILVIAPEETITLNSSDFKFDSNTKLNYTMELSTGWMLKLKTKRTINIKIEGDEVKKIETTTYVRL